jgi:predicted Zn-dependent protease
LKKAIAIALAVLVSAATLFASEDWRGNNRLAGSIVDKSTGKPVANAKLKIRIQRGSSGGPDVTSDAGGKWAILGISSGTWNIDVEAPGYVTRQVSVSLAEGQRIPAMKIEIEPQAVVAAPAPGEAPHEEVKIGGQTVSKEIAAAVEAGNAALTAKNFKEAVTNYEIASAAMPTFMPIKFALARSYYGAGDLKKAIAAMDEVCAADPANAQNASLLANMLLEDGQIDRGKEIIDKLPAGAVSLDSLLNAGIVLMNKKQPAAAAEYFTRAIAQDPKSHFGYYYRGLASIQMQKAKQGKPDLEKVLELAPDSAEAKDAREYLKSIK